MSITEHDPGGKVRLAMLPSTLGDAEFSACGRYRHWLSRDWSGGSGGDGTPYLLSIGMNPSTAAHDTDDPTIRRDIELTKRLHLPRLVKVNVMDYRATSPKQLCAPGVAPCSDLNRPTIRRLAADATRIVVCYGKVHKSLRRYADNVVLDLRDFPLWCLGTNSDGSPRHPLYLPGDTPIEPFNKRSRLVTTELVDG